MRRTLLNCSRLPLVFALVTAVVAPAAAEPKLSDLLGIAKEGTGSSGEPEVAARLVPADARPGDGVTLLITVKLPPGMHTYSTNPAFSGYTQIRLSQIRGLKPLTDEFVPDRPPKVEFDKILQQSIETHEGEVTWKRVYQVLPTVSRDDVALEGEIKLTVCDDRSCRRIPPQSFRVALIEKSGSGANAQGPAQPAFTHREKPKYLGKPGPAEVRVRLAPENAGPGERVTLTVAIHLEDDWHTYSITQQSGPGALPTVIKLNKAKGLVPIGESFTASKAPEIKTLEEGDQSYPIEMHHGTIQWSRQFEVQADADKEGYGISGEIRYLVCTGNRCLQPKTVSFELGDLTGAGQVPEPLPGDPSAAGPVVSAEFKIDDIQSAGGLPWYVLWAFLGGMILNVMPCVLPVLAIKVMSFVQQAGESRARILALNLTYAAGVIAVFLILATLTVVAGLGWGGLFQSSSFNLFMACLVFAMGLSLLGVFEIPVPGFVGASAGAQHREGLTGAFLTGILATLLATPCSGPFLGATMGWSVRQSPSVVYLIWLTMGLGMASPYVVFGMFPKAIKWLPKPGAWMIRLKEFAGFVLMGTVIFFIYFIEEAYVVPLLVMLLGIALALWMIGNLYDVTASKTRKLVVRVAAFALAGLIGGFGYSLADTGNGKTDLPWQEFSEQKLQEALAENKTVLVDFTADWCLTCKTVEKFALNTEKTRALVEEHGIVPLYADYTQESEEIKRWLEKFHSNSVPLTVIFPGKRPEEPIILRDLYTQSMLLEKLKEAVETEAAGLQQASLPSSSGQRANR